MELEGRALLKGSGGGHSGGRINYMYTREQMTRMNELFRRKLAAERDEVPTRDTARVDTSDLRAAFPDLDEETAAELALIELDRNWVATEPPYTSARGRLMGLWFTDAAGARRLGLL
jgi:hypothetical protein